MCKMQIFSLANSQIQTIVFTRLIILALIHAVLKGLYFLKDPFVIYSKVFISTYSQLLPFHSWFCDSSLSSSETASSFLMTYIQ